MIRQEEITKLKEKLAKLETQLKEEQNKNDLVKIKLSTGIIEVEKKLHTEMNTIDKIKIPEGYRLLTLSEFLEIYNNHKDKLDYGGLPDEIVKQPIIKNKDKYPYWNVWFRSLGSRSELEGNGDLGYGSRVRGVRFVKIRSKK